MSEIAAAPDLYASTSELREVCAACFRVIASVPDLSDRLEEELIEAGVKEGFGVRADTALSMAEGKARGESKDDFVICNWMQPLTPQMGPEDAEWWASRWRDGQWEFTPRTFDLDALHLVEERLTEEQWESYEQALCPDMFRVHGWVKRLINATAEQKIKALAAVILARGEKPK